MKWIQFDSIRLVLSLLAAVFLMQSALAQDANTEVQEARFKHIASELRCLVCKSQTLFDSTSDLASDLRQQVKIQIAQGKSDDEIRAFMVERYGDFILYKPPVKPTTWLLWGIPFLLLISGLFFLIRMARRASHRQTDEVLPAERLDQARAWLDNKPTDQSPQ